VLAGLQIEHIMPQKWSTHWPLEGLTVPSLMASFPNFALDAEFSHLVDKINFRNNAVQTFGNLTLVNQYLNPAASNGSFEMKISEYRNSILRLNRYFDGYTTWDEEAIIRRARALGAAICRIWPRATSDDL
jgi:hypothetical protein